MPGLCVMAFFAHPDDELDIGGALAACAAEGAEVVLVCATSGDQGGIADPALATRETLGAVRREELERSRRRLGIQHLHVLPYGDSGSDTPEPPPGSLVKTPAPAVIAELVGLIRRYRPQVVITYGPDGVYGHRDHRAIGAYATAAFGMAGEACDPATGEAPWRPARLYYLSLPDAQLRVLQAEGHGSVRIGQVTHELAVEPFIEAKEEAELCHRTQSAWFPHLRQVLPDDEYRRAVGTECLMLAQARPLGDAPELPPGRILQQLLS